MTRCGIIRVCYITTVCITNNKKPKIWIIQDHEHCNNSTAFGHYIRTCHKHRANNIKHWYIQQWQENLPPEYRSQNKMSRNWQLWNKYKSIYFIPFVTFINYWFPLAISQVGVNFWKNFIDSADLGSMFLKCGFIASNMLSARLFNSIANAISVKVTWINLAEDLL